MSMQTPRTDAVLQGCMNYDQGSDAIEFRRDLIQHARTLERELTAARQHHADWLRLHQKEVDDAHRDRLAACANVKELHDRLAAQYERIKELEAERAS